MTRFSDLTRRKFLCGSAAVAAGTVMSSASMLRAHPRDGTARDGVQPYSPDHAGQRALLAVGPLFGAAVTPYPGSGRSHTEEVAAHEADCGPMAMLRTYDGGQPADWFSRSGSGSHVPALPGWETRASWHSVKPNAEGVVSGALDGWITSYVESIPVTGVARFLTMWHEPEGKIPGRFSAATWKQAAHRFGQRVRAVGHPDVLYGPVFMSKFTLLGGANHVPAIMASHPVDLFSVCDFVGWDPYNEASKNGDYGPPWDDPSYYFDEVVAWTQANAALPIAIGETGFIPDPQNLTRRPMWLTAAASYAAAHDFTAFCYFDASVSNPWWLRCVADPAIRDNPTIQAWSQIYGSAGVSVIGGNGAHVAVSR